MIKTKEELKEYIREDNKWYKTSSAKWKFINRFTCITSEDLRKYLVYLRKYEYHFNNTCGSHFHTYMAYYYERKKNKLGRVLGIEIGPNCFGKGLSIWHYGNIVVNPSVKAGDFCTLHGSNCIGNNGCTEGTPKLGDNVDIGFGAVIIGDIQVADNTIIGANAVLNTSVTEVGTVYVGVPARKVIKSQ